MSNNTSICTKGASCPPFWEAERAVFALFSEIESFDCPAIPDKEVGAD